MRDYKGRFVKGHPQFNSGRTRFKKGHNTWNKGLSKETDERVKESAKKCSHPRPEQRRKIDENQLLSLYLKEKKSTIKISKIMNIPKATIIKRLQILKIPLRNKSEAELGVPKGPNPRLSQTLRRQFANGERQNIMTKEIAQKISKTKKRLIQLGLLNPHKNSHTKPNKKEIFLNQLLQENFPNEWKYVGDGQVVLGGNNPDFINCNGKKQIIELFGDYWHSPEKIKLRPDKAEEFRKHHFAQYGFRTLIIWERELKDPEQIIQKVKTFGGDKI